MTDGQRSEPRQMGTATPQHYTIAEVSAFLRLSQRHVRREIKSGELIATGFGRALRISDLELRRFIKKRRKPRQD